MRIPIQVRYNDYDDRGHVNNALYLTYFEIARMAAWDSLGVGDDPGFVLAEARVTYRSPALKGDPLAVEVSIGDVRSKSWVWRYRAVDERDERLIAEGETTQVMFDYQTRTTITIPAHVREALLKS